MLSLTKNASQRYDIIVAGRRSPRLRPRGGVMQEQAGEIWKIRRIVGCPKTKRTARLAAICRHQTNRARTAYPLRILGTHNDACWGQLSLELHVMVQSAILIYRFFLGWLYMPYDTMFPQPRSGPRECAQNCDDEPKAKNKSVHDRKGTKNYRKWFRKTLIFFLNQGDCHLITSKRQSLLFFRVVSYQTKKCTPEGLARRPRGESQPTPCVNLKL